MELSEPEQGIGYQEVLYFIFAVIEDFGSPFGMLSQTGIGMFKNALTVKFSQAMGISCKMRRYPVQNHADSGLVQFIDQVHKILRCSVTGSRCIVAGHLISPGTVKRMLCNTHQFYMGILHLLQIFYDPVRKLPVIVESFGGTVVRMLHKRTDMAFIDCHRLFIHVLFVPGFHPLGISPVKACNIGDDRCRTRPVLRIIGKRICFVELSAIPCIDQELIHRSLFHAGNEQPPDTAFSQLLHGMGFLIPFIECANDIHLCCIWCPYSEIDSLHAVFHRQMCTQFFVNIIMGPLGKKILICFGNKYLLLRHDRASRYTKSFSVRMIISSSSYLLANRTSKKCFNVFLFA